MNSSDELSLISRILNSENIFEESDLGKLIIKLTKMINTRYADLINNTDFSEKAKTLEELNNICSRVELFSKYSMFVGKNIVGIISDNQTSREEMTKYIIEIDEEKFNLKSNRSLPIIYFNGEDSLNLLNRFDFIEEIDKEDVQTITKDLMYKRKIDLRQSIFSIVNSQEFKYENIVFIVFPSFGDKYGKFFKEFIYATDMLILTGNETLNIYLRYLSKINYQKDVFIKSEFEKNLYNENLNIKSFKNKILKEKNYKKFNINFDYSMDNILLKVFKYYNDENKKLNLNKLALKKAMLEENNYDEIKSIRDSIEKKITNNNITINKLNSFRQDLFNLMLKIKDILSINIDECSFDEDEEKLLFERVKNLIEVGWIDEAKSNLELFHDKKSLKVNILNLKLNKAQGLKLNQNELIPLFDSENKSDFVLKAKIEFSEELNLNEGTKKLIIKNIKSIDTDKEFYLKAKFIETKDYELSKKYYKISAEKNFKEAKNKLFDICLKDENIYGMEHLAKLLDENANYFMAQHYKQTKFFRYLFYLKIAAALGNVEAIYELGEYYLNKKNNEIAIPLFEEVRKFNYKKQECSLNLGLAYYYTDKFQKAIDFFEQCNNERAYFILGKIYEYGQGRMKDLHKARDYYKKSSDLGNLKAKTKYIKIDTRLKEDEKRKYDDTRSYSSSSSYSSYSSSSTSSSSGCFVTTAACNALGKNENCDELIKFKELRDTYIIKQKDGEKIIEEYYKIAPIIVRKIEETGDSKNVYKLLWQNYITECYEYIQNGEFEKMKLKYIEMVKMLKNKYL